MQYVRSLGGSVLKTYQSLNPATLSGAIDVIVVEQPDGSLACSPFHVRFGKFSLLMPYEKKVEFTVNGVKQSFPMKLGEGGEAFFLFEASEDVPDELLTSPLISPATSPQPTQDAPESLPEPDFLDIADNSAARRLHRKSMGPELLSPRSLNRHSVMELTVPTEWDRPSVAPLQGEKSASDAMVEQVKSVQQVEPKRLRSVSRSIADREMPQLPQSEPRSISPPPISPTDAYSRAVSLSNKLSTLQIRTKVTEEGNVMLDLTGYKATEDQALQAEIIARKFLAEEMEGNYDIGSLIGADEEGNIWIYNSQEAKERADRELALKQHGINVALISDAASDPGYHSDDAKSSTEDEADAIRRRQSLSEPPPGSSAPRPVTYAKTLRLTSDQLKSLNLRAGNNAMTFSVGRATCPAYMFYWKYNEPIVISDIDGTITKSDALGHVLNMLGRDWTHLGVAKLYTNIVANGYHILYLTSRSVGQADSTRAYLKGVVQEKYRLPDGPVIMSPDRTMAALKREIYLRKPEVFKMQCLRDIRELFLPITAPFYAGFGNRLTDAMSYRSVNIPSNRIFTINTNAEVSLDLLTLTKYKSSYVSMREIVDHFFPPVKLLIKGGGEEFTDFTYWRDQPLDIDDFSASDSEDDDSVHSEEEDQSDDEEEEYNEALGDSFVSAPESDLDIDTAAARLSLDREGTPEVNMLPEGIALSNFPQEITDMALESTLR